ncbi:response regulator [Mastigocladus laminosus UU774]|nr:response regulator [Westiellopsis prolifica IICB1]TFI54296.1 response regulator [Mastigocladus laminosus UU774]
MNTVLVVEDGLTDLELISSCLQQAGYRVFRAKNSEEAEEKLMQIQPDLIFLDVILPGKSGFEICREIKNNPATNKIPIIFCSTKNSDVDKLWGNMLGGDAYLSKPINTDELVVTVKQLIK